MTEESDSVYRVHVGGAVAGQVVVGDHNVVINAQNSSVVVRDDPEPAVTRRTRPVSTALPRTGAGLLGRRMELALLMQWLAEGLPVEVCGAPGVGKSALLRRFAADRAAEGRDVVFLHAAGLAAPDVIQELFESCYDAPGYIPDLRRLRRLMISIRALVVVDDFEGSVEEFSALVDLLPASDLVVSTRQRVAWGRGRSLDLQGLDEQAALALMARELGRGLDENVAAALRLCRAANGYPRALLQAAAWLRGGGAATMPAAPDVPQRALVGGLGERSRRVLTVLCAVAGAHLSPALCRAMTRDTGSQSALDELAGLHLAESSGVGYRLAVDPRTVAGEWGIPQPSAADYLDAVLEWTNRAAPREIANAAPVIERVLEAAVVHGRQASACTLARKVAPVLGLTLLWGAWGTVLKLGRDAALASGSAADLAYFEHEDRVRRQALAAAAGAVVASGAGGKLLGGRMASTRTARKSVAMMSSHPVATGWVVALVVAAAITAVMLTTGRPAEVGSEAYITRLPPPPTDADGEPPRASVPASDGSRPLPPPGDGSCTRYADSIDFGAVAAGSAADLDVSFPALDCDDESAAFLEADSTFRAKRASCPSGGSGTCVFRVTFSPQAPGSYAATLVVPDDNGGRAVTIVLTGHTPGPGIGANSASPTPGVPASPPPNVSAVSPSPTAPQPPRTVPPTPADSPPPPVDKPPPPVDKPPPPVDSPPQPPVDSPPQPPVDSPPQPPVDSPPQPPVDSPPQPPVD
ncbi:ATP-binding protein, partial [Nocardia amamiensis]|uniref:ATP-binding protein n=1 Tax=Nocardia amamiensis TaxID=404578 RepID=UPI0033D7A5E1